MYIINLLCQDRLTHKESFRKFSHLNDNKKWKYRIMTFTFQYMGIKTCCIFLVEGVLPVGLRGCRWVCLQIYNFYRSLFKTDPNNDYFKYLCWYGRVHPTPRGREASGFGNGLLVLSFDNKTKTKTR